MYYDVERYLDWIETYKKELFWHFENDIKIIKCFAKILECVKHDVWSNRFNLSDYYSQNELGVSNVEILTTFSGSLIISIYGKYEYLLNILCETIKIGMGTNISYKMMKKQGIERALLYIKGLTTVDIKDTKEYKTLECWRILRNTLVHNYGVPKNEDDINKLEKINIRVSGETNTVITSMHDCIRLIDMFKKFFTLLLDCLIKITED
jgi:hypothetical protein